MKTNWHRTIGLILIAAIAAFLPTNNAAAADALLRLPNFDALESKASKVVSISLDEKLLGIATRFLDPKNADDSAARAVISGLTGVYVRSYTFDEDFAYPTTAVDAVRKQLNAPGWQRLVEVRSRKEHANVDIFLLVDRDKANGLAIIASEPREFTIVNIVGSIDLEKLHRLEGQMGIPKLQLEQKESRK